MDDVDYLGASGSVLSYNLYSYCENNPVIRTDYSGNSSVVGFGIQLYVNVSWFGCGLEIVWFPSKQFQQAVIVDGCHIFIFSLKQVWVVHPEK